MTYANAPRATDTGPGARAGTNGMAIAGLVSGIVGILVFAVILGPLAIIFGAIGRSRARAGTAGGRTMALWAIVLGIIDVVLFLVLLSVARHGGYYLHF